MWADNVLGNNPAGTTVFDKRPHAMTLKALMINTADQYPFTGTTSDLTRMHQGWGLPSARRFYDRRGLLEVVDEDNVLQPLDTHMYTAVVPDAQAELKVTRVYMDRPGTTSAALHRINDVTRAKQVEVLIGEVERGKGALPHSHPGIEQVCYLLEGEAHVEVAGEKFEMKPGEACFFPADAPHLFVVTSDRARVIVIYAPPYGEDPSKARRG